MTAADELVDVVDEDDRVVGCATRAAMRRRNLLHRAVYVLLFDPAGRVFVHRRTARKDVYPAHWDATVGGVVAAGETYAAAAARELAEEVGVHDAPLVPRGPIRWTDAHTRLIGFVYAAVHDGPVVLQAEEIDAGEFVTPAEAHRILEDRPSCPDGALVFRTYGPPRS